MLCCVGSIGATPRKDAYESRQWATKEGEADPRAAADGWSRLPVDSTFQEQVEAEAKRWEIKEEAKSVYKEMLRVKQEGLPPEKNED